MEMMTHRSENGKALVSIDEMVLYVGEFKTFQWIVGGMFCIMMIPTTFQVLIMYFGALNPPWRCAQNSTVCTANGTFTHENRTRCSMPRTAWEFTEPKDYSIVTDFDIYCDGDWVIELSTSILFVGSIFGSFTLGWAADNYGRKVVLFLSMVMILMFGFGISFLSNLHAFILFRFIIGVFIPGTNIQMSILLSEMTGSRFRPLSGNLNWTFFPIALCIMSLKAYLIRTWKLFFIVCTAPYVFVVLFYLFVPESVRWLRLHDKKEKVIETFERIARWNSKTIPPDVSILPLSSRSMKRKTTPLDLFRTRKIALVTINQGYSLFMHGMVYYGISLAADELGGSIYLTFFLLSLIEVPAGFFSIYICHKIGRKKSTIIGVLGAGLACVILAFIPLRESAARIVFGMVGKFCIASSFNTIGIWAMELYPTTIRAQGLGYLNVVCRIGAAVAPWVIKELNTLHNAGSFICMGITALASSGFLCFLSETKGLPTLETSEDVKVELKNPEDSPLPMLK